MRDLDLLRKIIRLGREADRLIVDDLAKAKDVDAQRLALTSQYRLQIEGEDRHDEAMAKMREVLGD